MNKQQLTIAFLLTAISATAQVDSLAKSVSKAPVELSQNNIIFIASLATAGIVAIWWAFWFFVSKSDEKVTSVLLNPSFFKTVAVIGVIASVTVLSLSGRLDGNITGAILSGIVGYVLGQISNTKPG